MDVAKVEVVVYYFTDPCTYEVHATKHGKTQLN